MRGRFAAIRCSPETAPAGPGRRRSAPGGRNGQAERPPQVDAGHRAHDQATLIRYGERRQDRHPQSSPYVARAAGDVHDLTIVFAVYAVGVITALVLAGHISDWTGRKRIMLPALGFEMVAAVLFLTWPALPGLILARFLTGVGVGLITATATAYLLELHGAHRPGGRAGPVRGRVGGRHLGGLGVGTLGGRCPGAVSSPAPLSTPYVVFLILLALGVVAVLGVPETVLAPAVRPRYRPQRPRVGAGDRAAYMAAAGRRGRVPGVRRRCDRAGAHRRAEHAAAVRHGAGRAGRRSDRGRRRHADDVARAVPGRGPVG